VKKSLYIKVEDQDMNSHDIILHTTMYEKNPENKEQQEICKKSLPQLSYNNGSHSLIGLHITLQELQFIDVESSSIDEIKQETINSNFCLHALRKSTQHNNCIEKYLC